MVKNRLKVLHILEGLQQAEHLSTLNVFEWAAIDKHQRIESVRTRADLEIPKHVPKILMLDLGMEHVMAKFVPWLLLPEQKEHRAAGANDLI